MSISVLDLPAHRGKRVCLDASVAINILATGYAEEILTSHSFDFCIEEMAHNEVERHPIDGESANLHLGALRSSGVLAVDRISGSAQSEFVALVGGGLSGGLGDGEAATLALANEVRGIAAIDDQKALKIAEDRYVESPIVIVSTLDLLARQEVESQCSECLSEAITNALFRARMRVPARYEVWVRDHVGIEKFRSCSSIRLAARMRQCGQ